MRNPAYAIPAPAADDCAAAMLHREGRVMTARHTPGPWAVAADRHIIADPSRDGRMVASCDPHEFLPEQRAANARLIAAAPDLLAVLCRLLADVEGEHAGYWSHAMEITNPDHPWHDIVMATRAAIARAERSA
ncbi:MAG TPA: hypothetical protein VEX11_17760 [Acetobacteraceae bacterium]|nr:hypothetical protein [Acetobacteraceae bacterium]